MKIALVIDWLDKYGGAERVITSICRVFKIDKCYTLINLMTEKDQKLVFAGQSITTEESKLNRFGKHFRYLLLFFPFFIRQLKIDKDTQVIISSSHAVAKGIRKTNKNQIHISYFQARNLKYIWSEYKLYFGWFRFLFFPFIYVLRKIDVNNSKNPDYIVSNSQFVKKWVKSTYNRDSVVIYPPVNISDIALVTEKENYYVTVGRLEPYKRFDLIIKAFNITEKELIVVGSGSQLNELKKIAKNNIKFVGFLESKQVYEYINKAKGFVHAGVEDFGIAPIEAQASGTPVIAYGEGGVLETVIENVTGVFFKEQSYKSLVEAINKFEKITFNSFEIRKNSERFSKEVFEENFNNFIKKSLDNH